METEKYKHNGVVRNGIIIFDSEAMYRKELFINEGKRVTILIYSELELTPVNSNDFAFYFGGIIHELHQSDFYYGKSKETIHHELMKMFWAEVRVENGKEFVFVPSISKFNREQFNKHVEQVIFHASELGIKIKDREEYYHAKRFRMK